MATNYHRVNHSKFLIKLHIVFVTKYRKKLLTGSIDKDMKQLFFDISKEKGFVIDAMETESNHIHLLVDVPPKLSALNIIHSLKSISTFRIYKQHYAFLKKHFWSENTFWSDGYFVCSTGDASIDTIRKYIQEQG